MDKYLKQAREKVEQSETVEIVCNGCGAVLKTADICSQVLCQHCGTLNIRKAHCQQVASSDPRMVSPL